MVGLIANIRARLIRAAASGSRGHARGAYRHAYLSSALGLAVWAALSYAQVHAQQNPRSSEEGSARCHAEVARLAKMTTGTVGVAAIHIESGREVHLNSGERFPMASTFKIPLAVQLLTLVDQGSLSLDKMISLRPSDLHPGSGTLSQLFDDPGVSLSLRNLLELMLIISDNSATDIIWKEAGGAPTVQARLSALSVKGISVDRPTVLLIANATGIDTLPPESEWTPTRLQELLKAVPEAQRDAARTAFYNDQRDTATPEAMAQLLAKIWRKEALSRDRSELLLDIMYRCTTGPARLKGLLRSDIRVAHKTGSLTLGVTNDVGIIELPDGAGHIAVAVFVKQSVSDVATQEQTIAHIARAIYDYFLFSPAA